MTGRSLQSLFGSRRRVPATGEAGLVVWNDPDNYWANDGLGMCNTGSDETLMCVLGGAGCNVDHVQIARENLISQQQRQQSQPPEAAGPDQ